MVELDEKDVLLLFSSKSSKLYEMIFYIDFFAACTMGFRLSFLGAKKVFYKWRQKTGIIWAHFGHI